MQHPALWAWGLLLLVLSLDGVACWGMLWQKDVRLSLVSVAVSMGLLLTSYSLWRRGR